MKSHRDFYLEKKGLIISNKYKAKIAYVVDSKRHDKYNFVDSCCLQKQIDEWVSTVSKERNSDKITLSDAYTR